MIARWLSALPTAPCNALRTLDHAIETLGRRPVARIDPPVLAALRLGAYQLGYLDGVPRYAAVNESVELVRAAGAGRAVSFANAVLRRVAEGIRPLLESLPESSPGEAALLHSYPDWVADTWWRDLGADAARDLMRAQNEPPEIAVRLVRGEIDGRRDPDVPGAWVVERVDELAVEEGRIWPQSRASQLVGHVVGSVAGERVLDVCAAPGGKATMLAGEVVAVDLSETSCTRAGGQRATARSHERHRRPGGRARPAARADRVRPRAGRRAVLGARRARRPA